MSTATELDLALVPGFESELRCESEHEHGDPCSTEVTHINRTKCGVEALICSLRASWTDRNLYRLRCAYCNEEALFCWKVVPV